MRPVFLRLLAVPTLFAVQLAAQAYDVNDKLSVSGVLAAAGQCRSVSARLPAETYGEGGLLDEFENQCRGAGSMRLKLSFRADEYNELFFKLGFAAGNGLNTVSPWTIAPWAADLEDDVKDINGRNRDYLLEAWYKHIFRFANEGTLGATIGILDTAFYLDDNEYASDEYTQFMNEAFVNASGVDLPTYDAGAVLEWEYGTWSLNAIGMNVGENEYGNNYNFWGVEVAYQSSARFGTGNYRLNLLGTSSAYLDPAGRSKERRLGGGISFDQAFGEDVGVFLRMAWEQEDAAIDHKAAYSGGLNFDGSAWDRELDNVGIGYAYLEGGNLDIERTHVFETYYRLGLNDYVGITADLQYMKDDRTKAGALQDNPDGWIFGLRIAAEF